MYFTPGQGGGAQLMDGDKIASLAALLVKDLISQLPANGSLPTVRHAAAPAWGILLAGWLQMRRWAELAGWS